MRLCALLALAACGTEEGAILAIRAPDGPADVARLEIVLATEGMTVVEDQRRAPRDFAGGETVAYYRQRATAGVFTGVGRANAFSVRVEPNVAMVPDRTFVPFLVAFDAADHVVGIGAVLDETSRPAPITVEGGAARKYFVDMVPLSPMDPARAMGTRESLATACGVAWRPGATQLRLLLGDDTTDAPLDLDCDGHAADESDCDDLRPLFHAGATEACDGVDQNCDGTSAIVQACPNASCPGGGVQLCDDRTGEPAGACLPDAACACAGGTCASCSLAHRPTSNPAKQSPCAPAAGKMKFPACLEGAPCRIDVLSATPPWAGYVSTSPTMGFATSITVTTGEAYLELKAGEVTGQAGDSVGTLHLAVTQGGETRLVPVDIQLGDDTQCSPISGTSLYAMSCGP